MKEVKFDEFYFVAFDVYIKPRESTTMKPVKFKVDSGANSTTISREKLLELGYDEAWIKSGQKLEGNARPSVASGRLLDDCYVVVLPEISIGGWVGRNWRFLTSLSEPFRFLLGTDSMRFFNWHFDYQNGVCRFELIEDVRDTTFNPTGQSIHAIDELEAHHGV